MAIVVVLVVAVWFVLYLHSAYKVVVRRLAATEPPALPTRPHGVVRPAVGDFGESCLEVDVKDWRYVRELELGIYNCYWHTAVGAYLPAGITPDEEAEKARLAQAAERADRQSSDLARRAKIIADGILDESDLTPAVINRMTMREYAELRTRAQAKHRCRNCGSTDVWQSSVDGHWRCHKAECQPCWCDYCHGRTGVHGDDARALYAVQVEVAKAQGMLWGPMVSRAIVDAQPNLVFQNLPAQEQTVEGVRMQSTAIVAHHAPWHQDVEDELIAAGLHPQRMTDNLSRWDFTRDNDGNRFKFTASYEDGSSVEVERIGDYRNVTTRDATFR